MERWIRYKALLKVYLSAQIGRFFNGSKLRRGFNRNTVESESKGRKAVNGIFTALAFLVIVAVLVFAVLGITVSAITQGFINELPYVILGVCQLSILILGGNVILSNLYFSDDTSLLLSLPVTPFEVFAAKFTVSYLSQLFLSAFFIPVMIAFGVTMSLNGIVVGASFYVLAVLSFLLLPAFPTFLMGVFSAPIMLFISFFRNKERAKMIFTVLSSLLGMILYFIIIFGAEFAGSGEGEELLSPQSVTMVKNISKWLVFNHHFCQAIMGHDVLINALFYILECVGSFVVAIALCGFFYKRIMRIMQESSVAGKRSKNKEESFGRKSLTKALFIKDIKMIMKTPTLLFSSVIGIVLVPVVTVIYGKMSLFSGADTSPYKTELMQLGLNYYFVLVMTVCSNSIIGVSVSAEKSNFSILKTLPITGMQFIRSKLFVAMVMNGLITLAFFVAFMFVGFVPIHPIFGVLLVICYFFSGTGMAIWEIMRDLKNPNFRFNNINELTRNNKNMMKPIFTVLGVALAGMITAIACGAALPDETIYLGYILFFLVAFTVCGLVFFLPYSSMKKHVDELYESLEV